MRPGRCAILLFGCVSLMMWQGTQALAQIQPGVITMKLDVQVQWSPEMNVNSPNFELTPTNMAFMNDGTGRVLVPTLAGTIRVLIPNNDSFELLPQPLINSSQVGFQLQQETGMTAIALHPDFAGDPGDFGYGKLYTISSENPVTNGGLGDADVDFSFSFEVHQEVLREWNISPIVGNANVNTLPNLEVNDSREMLRIDQPGPFHNMYDMSFNRASVPGDSDYGLLYISLGDGGNSGSNSSNFNSQIREPQDLRTIYGNILRIDPDPSAHPTVRFVTNSFAPNAGQPTYSIPDSNPFNGDEVIEDREADSLAEIYAYGMRSPYRFNFDSMTGELYSGCVGEVSREEITKVESGTNAGWGRFEGTNFFNGSVNLGGTSPHTPPVLEYDSSEGRTVVCGIVYRGNEIPELQGKMVFADFGNHLPSARLFYGIVDPMAPDFGTIYEMLIDPEGDLFPIDTNGDGNQDNIGMLPDRIFSVEEGPDNELYLVSGQDPRSFLPSVPGAYIVRLTGTFETTELEPNTLTVFRGILISGSAADIADSDDQYVSCLPGFTLNSDELPIWLETETAVQNAPLQAMTFELEANANTPGLSQYIELFNYLTNDYELFDVSAASFSTDSTVVVTATGDLSRFVESGTNQMRARTGWQATSFTLLFPWTVNVDHVSWTVTQ